MILIPLGLLGIYVAGRSMYGASYNARLYLRDLILILVIFTVVMILCSIFGVRQ